MKNNKAKITPNINDLKQIGIDNIMLLMESGVLVMVTFFFDFAVG